MKTTFKKLLSIIVCVLLIAAMASFASGCGDNEKQSGTSSVSSVQSVADETTAKKFTFKAVGIDGKEETFEFESEEETVGDALLKEGLIAGDDSEYGLYVKTVNGETHDYKKDGKYWAFYVNGEYASSSVDSTPIEEGATYSFKAE